SLYILKVHNVPSFLLLVQPLMNKRLGEIHLSKVMRYVILELQIYSGITYQFFRNLLLVAKGFFFCAFFVEIIQHL
ncbi:hypothetical protein HMPREF1331_03094, partial [Enterococcus faecalis ERV25]